MTAQRAPARHDLQQPKIDALQDRIVRQQEEIDMLRRALDLKQPARKKQRFSGLLQWLPFRR